MIPNEVLLWVLLLTLGGGAAGIVVAMVMTAYLRWEIPGGKFALLMIIWGLGLAYALPILYVWTIDSSYVHEWIASPVPFIGVALPIVVLALSLWLFPALEKRRTRDKGNSDE